MLEYHVPSEMPALTKSNTADFAYARAESNPSAVALRRHDGSGWADVTIAEFARQVTAVAKGLMAAGIGRGERVAVMSKTRYEWSLVDFAIFAAGAVVVPVYETSSAEQIEWILSDSGAKAAFVETAEHGSLMGSVRDRAPALGPIWQFDDGGIETVAGLGGSVTDAEADFRRRSVGPEDLASIIYTSGTTGRPKGCRIVHRNFVSEVDELLTVLRSFFNDTASTLLFLPIAHVFGRVIHIGAIAAGCTLGHSEVQHLLDDLASFKPTFVLAVPRVFEKVYNGAKQKAHGDGKGKIFDLSESVAIRWSEATADGRKAPLGLSVQHAIFDKLVYAKLRAAMGGSCRAAVSGGAPLGSRLGHFFRGVGVTIYEGYGLTETTAGITVNSPDHLRIGTVGRPVPATTVRVADDGELLFKSNVVFDGYWNNEAATQDAIDDDGWFHTGDVGEIDPDGFVKITGRKKEIIVTAGGKNVAPAVLEDRVRAHWLISQCLVVGDAQPFIAALITIDPEAWPAWLQQRGRPATTTVAEMAADPRLVAEVQTAIDEANKAVSHAESIRKFTILPEDWTEAGGQITPSLKLKRNVVLKEQSEQIAQLYSGTKAAASNA